VGSPRLTELGHLANLGIWMQGAHFFHVSVQGDAL